MRQEMIPVVQEVTYGEHGLGKGSKDDDPQFGQKTEFGQETQVQYAALERFDYGNVRPYRPTSRPLLGAPPQPAFFVAYC